MIVSENPHIRMIHGDCMDFMKGLPDNAYELAIVDPPYGLEMDNQVVRQKPDRLNTQGRGGEKQYKEAEWDKSRPNPEYFKQLFRVSKNQIIWGANYFCNDIPDGHGWIFWDKQMGENNFSAGEFAFQSLQKRSAKFSYSSVRVAGTRIHPTQKPVALYKWLLKNYANPGDKILDTHGGSGSIAIACYDMGFDLDWIELNKDYYKAAVKRFNQHKAQPAIFHPAQPEMKQGDLL